MCGAHLERRVPLKYPIYVGFETGQVHFTLEEFGIQSLEALNSELFEGKMDLAGFKTDVDRIFQWNPSFEMGPTHLAFWHVLLPPYEIGRSSCSNRRQLP